MHVLFLPQAGNQPWWEIVVNGEVWRVVHRSIFGKKPRFPAINSEEDLQSEFDRYEYLRVKGYVLWRLSKQHYHSEQLLKLLRDRKVQDLSAFRVIEECCDLGLLDDQAWIDSFLRSQGKKYGLSFILKKLYAKGVSSKTINAIAASWDNHEDEIESIQKLIKKRAASKNIQEPKERQKMIASLMRKGYSYEQVRKALESFEDSN